MKLSNNNIINLEDYRVSSSDNKVISKVFTGRDRGQDVRIRSEIDVLETKYNKIKIIIPNNVFSINPSFFEELFVNVVTKLGKERFLDKFEFTSEGRYNYEKPLNEAIQRILRNNTALG